MKKHPLVSIGMPIFNEARFITRSLEALISQNYPCLELIISDNASTDGTSEIAHPFLPLMEELQPYLEQIWANRQPTNAAGPFHQEFEQA